MIISRVFVGKYTVGTPETVQPPPYHMNDPTLLFDCTVDQMIHPSIFVVYRDAQAFPEYVIRFVENTHLYY